MRGNKIFPTEIICDQVPMSLSVLEATRETEALDKIKYEFRDSESGPN